MAIAIIAEYNPFHNGHIYQLEYVKKNFPNDKIYIILGGNFTQRGEISLANFETKKKIALKYGADFVIRLPFEYTSQAAHIFAQGALKLIFDNKIDKIIFGSESNDVQNLYNLANLWKNNIDEYNVHLKKALKLGNSFPNAASIALEKISSQKIIYPNDILGFEYVKQIVLNNYPIQAYSLKRTVDYNETTPTGKFASATYLRKLISQNKSISQFSPMEFSQPVCSLALLYPKFQEIIRQKSPESLRKIWLVKEGIENLFKKHIDQPDLDSFLSATNSKRYTNSRIKRTMLYILFNIEDPSKFDETTVELDCWKNQN
ncbi:nucleotidyltransferase [Mesomycoplasma ovipneumoniae]|uniref:nucleotidyltransferase n=1 Tax=Mesomycoplasma ovipneumoniae TaxID=29562 RepID=UPI00311B0956